MKEVMKYILNFLMDFGEKPNIMNIIWKLIVRIPMDFGGQTEYDKYGDVIYQENNGGILIDER